MASLSPTAIPCSSPSPCFHLSPLSGSRVISGSSPPTRLFLGSTRQEAPRLGVTSSRCNGRPLVCPTPSGLSTSERLALLVSEFQALSEPIDRVKRLLHYATVLPEFEESARVDSNRVTGCTAQVWLDVGFEDSSSPGRRMRLRADSDSEIGKGFCSCLVWVLDGACPEEVLAVRAEDLGPMNMGVVAHSRVNTWHNVLISMQRRTEGLLMVEGRHNIAAATDGNGHGSDPL